MKISPEYLAMNRELHARGGYGVSGSKYVVPVMQIAQLLNTRDILDYGCGQRTLEQALGFPIRNYDPAIPGLDTPPEPADLVVCTDVLEHIEPDCLNDVLDDLQRLTKQAAFFVIANRAAKKILPDGRNAHLIQEDAEWWRPRLAVRFTIHQVGGQHNEHFWVLRKRQSPFGSFPVY
jgi:methyltransferase family protein